MFCNHVTNFLFTYLLTVENLRDEAMLNKQEHARTWTEAVDRECDNSCGDIKCGTKLCNYLFGRATHPDTTERELDEMRHTLVSAFYRTQRRRKDLSPHMHRDSKLFDYTRVPRKLLPTVVQANSFKGEDVFPFLSFESLERIKAARDVFNQRHNSMGKADQLRTIMNKYITTGEGTIEQAIVWAAANARADCPGADVLFTTSLPRGYQKAVQTTAVVAVKPQGKGKIIAKKAVVVAV
jgi:hypothetical protein